MHSFQRTANVSTRRLICKIIALVMLCALSASHSYAAKPSLKDRQIVTGLSAIKKGKWDEGKRYIAASKDPLAATLYYWLYYQKKSSKQVSSKSLVRFLNKHPAWPANRSLRLKAEKDINKEGRTAESVRYFDRYDPLTADGFFVYVDSLLAQGQTAKAKTLIQEWWTEKPMGRDDQKKLFSKYQSNITLDSHRKRLDRLLFDKHYTNARAVARVLGQGYPELTEARIALANKKSTVNELIAKVPSARKNDPGLLYERLRWRRRKGDNRGAVQVLRQSPSMDRVINAKDWWLERHILIRRYIEQKNYRGAYLLAKAHGQASGLPFAQGEWLAGWLSLRFLNNPTQALKHFETLHAGVKSPISKARGAYWAGRAAAAMKATESAQNWYGRAAQFQTAFYGQTAGAELGRTQALSNAAPPNLTADDMRGMNANPLIRSAIWLHGAGMAKESAQFINAFIDQNPTPKTYLYAAKLTQKMGLRTTSLRIAKKATKKGLFFTAQSYPVLTNEVRNVRIDWALTHALMRQESQFDQYARSPAGALGLMQLMPATAKETARKIGVSHSQARLTSDPAHNIALGTAYFNQMLKRFGGSYPMAIAAYNAGPGRVDKWIKTNGDPRLGQVDLIDWIEMIPIYETRNYVQRVLEGMYVYNLRLRKAAPKKTTEPIHVARVYKNRIR